MSSLRISQGSFRLSDQKVLTIDSLTIQSGESWAFIGTNGSGKSALARALTGQLVLQKGEMHSDFRSPFLLSFEKLQALVSDEWQRNNTDLLSPDEEDTGRFTADIIQDVHTDPAQCSALATQFGIEHLLSRRFKHLSTGETRKALLCQALMAQPDLLILDEPFDGLDVASREQLAAMLATLSTEGYTLILVLNRFEDIPDFVQYAGVLAECALSTVGEKKALLQEAIIAQLASGESLSAFRLPEADSSTVPAKVPAKEPLITLRQGTVTYQDKAVLDRLDWEVLPSENWHIVGPNGAGKSTLLSLVTGDHPQGYSNDLTLFGRRRGSGETIWDIKKHIGYVSSSLHLDYRVSTTARSVILSGFFDSIGLYQAISDKQQKLGTEWLTILGMSPATADAPFHSLSWGQQRLALIARALVKHPRLLILDEPLQGLDPLNRQLIRQFTDRLIAAGHTQLLFVSHHTEDAPACITHRLTFVPKDDGYQYHTEKLV